jgi:hypothetical protein
MAKTDKKKQADYALSVPIVAMMVCAVASALIVGASFWIINYWPLPVSVAPYYEWNVGVVWGFLVGGLFGYCIGWLTDERHFTDTEY